MVPVVVGVIGYRDGSAGDITCLGGAIDRVVLRSRAAGHRVGQRQLVGRDVGG